MRFIDTLLGLAPAALALLVGCGPVQIEGGFRTNQTEVNQIRNNADLTGQEQREQLAALGLDDVTINGLLRGERTANQFGGTENSAFDKVTGDQLTALTPDEVQLYGDLSSAATFTDAQAQELVDLLATQNLSTVDQLKTWLEDNDIDSATGLTDDDVKAVFVDTDPDTLIPNLP
jgi:hypothetical protein